NSKYVNFTSWVVVNFTSRESPMVLNETSFTVAFSLAVAPFTARVEINTSNPTERNFLESTFIYHSPGAGRTFRTMSLGAEEEGGEFSAKVTVSKRISFTLASKSSSPTRAKYVFPAGALRITRFIDG